MTSIHEYQTGQHHRRRSKRNDPEAILQEISALISTSTTPLQQSAIAEELESVSEELTHRLAAVKQKEENDRLYGEFLTTERVLQQLKLRHRQALNGRLERNTILRVKTADGRNAYPALQFESGQVIPAVKTVLQTLLPVAATEWTVLDWLVHPRGELNGDRPIDRLRNGEAEPVFLLAETEAAAWTA